MLVAGASSYRCAMRGVLLSSQRCTGSSAHAASWDGQWLFAFLPLYTVVGSTSVLQRARLCFLPRRCVATDAAGDAVRCAASAAWQAVQCIVCTGCQRQQQLLSLRQPAVGAIVCGSQKCPKVAIVLRPGRIQLYACTQAGRGRDLCPRALYVRTQKTREGNGKHVACCLT